MALPFLAAIPGILQGALAATSLIGALRDLFSPQPKVEDFTAQARQINEAEFARARENLMQQLQQSALSRGLFGSGPMAEALSRALADLNAQQASATAQTATQLWQQAQGQRTARQGQAGSTLFGLLELPFRYADVMAAPGNFLDIIGGTWSRGFGSTFSPGVSQPIVPRPTLTISTPTSINTKPW